MRTNGSWAVSRWALLALLVAGMVMPVAADPVSLNTWYGFNFLGPGTFATGSPAPPWTFTGPAILTVVDCCFNGDNFRIFDNGVEIGTTPAIDPSLVHPAHHNCGASPETCLADPFISRGAFSLGAGSHSITIQVIASPFASGAAFFRLDATGDCVHTVHGHVSSQFVQVHHGLHGHAVANNCPPHAGGHLPGLTLDPADGLALGLQGPESLTTLITDQHNGPNTNPVFERGAILRVVGSAAGLYVGGSDRIPAEVFTAPAFGPRYNTASVPEVRVGGVPATVLFSGMAPGMVGLWSIEVEIPVAAPSGDTRVVVIYEGQERPVASFTIR